MLRTAAVVLAAALFTVSTGLHAGQRSITYSIVNAVESAGGNEIVGDVLVERSDGSVDLVPFQVSNASLSTPGSDRLPAVCDFGYSVTPANGGGGLDDQVRPLIRIIIPAVCIGTIIITRGWCSSDCGDAGVSHWDSGICGHKSTCVCNPPKPQGPGEGPGPDEWPLPEDSRSMWMTDFFPLRVEQGGHQLIVNFH